MHVVVLGIVFMLVLMFRAVGMSVLVRMAEVILGFLVRVSMHGSVGMTMFFFRLMFHSAVFSLGGAISLVAAPGVRQAAPARRARPVHDVPSSTVGGDQRAISI